MTPPQAGVSPGIPPLKEERMSLRRPFVSRIQAVRSWGTAEIVPPGFLPDEKRLGAPPMSIEAVMA
jgi:hypothetical protein